MSDVWNSISQNSTIIFVSNVSQKPWEITAFCQFYRVLLLVVELMVAVACSINSKRI